MYEGVPGLVETRTAYDETTLVVDPARVVEACTHLRDVEGFNVLADLAAADYLGWGERGDAVYFNNPADYVPNLREPVRPVSPRATRWRP